MPISIKITADTPQEYADLLAALAAGTGPGVQAVALSTTSLATLDKALGALHDLADSEDAPGFNLGENLILNPDFADASEGWTKGVSAPAADAAPQTPDEGAKPALPPLRGLNAQNECDMIVRDFAGAETVDALDAIKRGKLDVIDRLPKVRQADVQAAFDKRLAELSAPVTSPMVAQALGDAPRPPAPGPITFDGPDDVMPAPAPAPQSIASMFETPAAPVEQVSTTAPATAPATADAFPSADEVRAAMEACMAQVSFIEADKRMKAQGFSRLSEVPPEKRAAFIAALREGLAA